MTGLAPTRRWRLTGGLALAVGLTMLALGLPDGALTATLPVNTTADLVALDNHCSLREAISAANNDAPVFVAQGECPAGNGADTISLPAGHYTLGTGANDDLNASGDLDILGVQPLTITSAGAAATTIDGGGHDRVIEVLANRALTLRGITITGGHAPDGANGLAGNPSTAGQNVQGGFGGTGADGGGILNAGTLTVVDSTISGNTAGKGGNAGSGQGGAGTMGATGGAGGSGASGNAGNGGNGGGIYTSGNLTLTRVTVSSNTAGAGGQGAAGIGGQGGLGTSGAGGAGGLGRGGDEGDGGFGGGVAEESGGLMTIDRSVISANTAGAAGAGGLGDGGDGGVSTGGSGAGGTGGAGLGGDAGTSGRGGGIGAFGSLVMTRSLVAGNAGGAGANGGPGTGGGGGPSFVSGGTAGNAGNSTGGGGSSGGSGGGIWIAGGPTLTRTITNTTITGNASGAGGGGGSGTGGTGGGVLDALSTKGNGGNGTGGDGGSGGSGAGLDTAGAPTIVNHATISSSVLGGPGGGGAGNGGGVPGGVGMGGNGGNATGGAGGSPGTAGAVLAESVALTLRNTIVSANGGPSCGGTLTNGGHDIVFPDASCPGTNVDPMLQPLASNGGPTQTQALPAASPALDAVPVGGAGCAATDQRGVVRPNGPGCDIGAFERARPGVVTGGATGVSQTGATLTGEVTPNGRVTMYHFEIGPTTSYGTSTPDQNAGSGVSAVAAGAAVQGLAPATTYHYRLVATSANGTTVGGDGAFTTSGPGGPGGPGGSDTTKPVFLSASLSRKVFAVNPRGRAEVPVTAAKRGTTFRYSLSEAARVVFTIHRVRPGRRVRGKCRRVTSTNRSKPRCKRYVSPRRFAAQATAGANRKKFSGRIGKRALRRGPYRATLVATDTAGNHSKRKRLAFRIVRP